MPKVPILMPQLGESIAEATIMRILVGPGDIITADQEIIEVETNKATMGVTTVCSGTVSDILVKEGETLVVGTCLGIVEVTEDELERSGATPLNEAAAPHASSNETATENSEEKVDQPYPEIREGIHFQLTGESYQDNMTKVEPSVRGLPVPVGMKGASYISPRMRARMDELGFKASDISAIVGSGTGGRVTIEDLENYISYIETWPKRPASSMRLSVADAMRRSWTRPLASCGRPCNVEAMMTHRKNSLKNGKKKAGPALYFLRAFAMALAEMPICAGYLAGNHILYPKSIDIGVAVQVDDGVIVPVMRNVSEHSLNDLVDEYNNLIKLARTRRVPPEMCKGGIATISNFGGFGLTYASPMPLPNESIVLGVSAVEKVPVWSEEVQTFIPVSRCNIVSAFDHRVVDGGDAGRLLSRVAEIMQHPEYM